MLLITCFHLQVPGCSHWVWLLPQQEIHKHTQGLSWEPYNVINHCGWYPTELILHSIFIAFSLYDTWFQTLVFYHINSVLLPSTDLPLVSVFYSLTWQLPLPWLFVHMPWLWLWLLGPNSQPCSNSTWKLSNCTSCLRSLTPKRPLLQAVPRQVPTLLVSLCSLPYLIESGIQGQGKRTNKETEVWKHADNLQNRKV